MNKHIVPSDKSLKVVIMTKTGKLLTIVSKSSVLLALPGTMDENYQSSREKLVELEDLLGGYFGFSVHDRWFIIDNLFSSQNSIHHEQFLVYATSEKMMARLTAKNRDMVIYDMANISEHIVDNTLKRFIAHSPFADNQIKKNNW